MIYVSYVPLHAHISVLEYVLVTEIIVNHITSRNPFIFFRLSRWFCIHLSCPPAGKKTGVFFYSQISLLSAPVVNWHKKSPYFCASCTLDISLSPL